MKRTSLLLALLLVACTQQKATTVLSPPADIHGDYSTAWSSPAGLQGVARIAGDTVSFDIYPCRPVGTGDVIGGLYVFEPPAFTAEMKSLDGVTKVSISGSFVGEEMHGSFEVRVLGVVCTTGDIVMEKR